MSPGWQSSDRRLIVWLVGPPVGLFLQVVQRDPVDVEVPGEPYGFSILKQAQSLGDLQSLQSRNYPVLRVDLGEEPDAGWRALTDSIQEAVR